MSLSAEAVNKIERDAMNVADTDENPYAFDLAQEAVLPLVADLRAARAETVEKVAQTVAVTFAVAEQLRAARAENEKLRTALDRAVVALRAHSHGLLLTSELARAAAVGLEEEGTK